MENETKENTGNGPATEGTNESAPSNVTSIEGRLSAVHTAVAMTLVNAAEAFGKAYGRIARTIFSAAREAGSPEMFDAIRKYASGIMLKNAQTGDGAGVIKTMADYKRKVNPSYASFETTANALRKQWGDAGPSGANYRRDRQKYLAHVGKDNPEIDQTVPDGWGDLTSDRYAGDDGVTLWRNDVNVTSDGLRVVKAADDKAARLATGKARRGRTATEARAQKPSDHLASTIKNEETVKALSLLQSKIRQLSESGFPAPVLNNWLYDCIGTATDMLSTWAERQKRALDNATNAQGRAKELPEVPAEVVAPAPDDFDHAEANAG